MRYSEMMNYNLKGTGIAVTDELRNYIEKRLAHSEKFIGNDTTEHTDVELEFNERNETGKYRAEFTTSIGGRVYRASEWGNSLHEAIDSASSELSKELKREKKQKLKTFRHSAVKVKEYLRGWRRKV